MGSDSGRLALLGKELAQVALQLEDLALVPNGACGGVRPRGFVTLHRLRPRRSGRGTLRSRTAGTIGQGMHDGPALLVLPPRTESRADDGERHREENEAADDD